MLLAQGSPVYMVQAHHERGATYVGAGYLVAASTDERPADKLDIPL